MGIGNAIACYRCRFLPQVIPVSNAATQLNAWVQCEISFIVTDDGLAVVLHGIHDGRRSILPFVGKHGDSTGHEQVAVQFPVFIVLVVHNRISVHLQPAREVLFTGDFFVPVNSDIIIQGGIYLGLGVGIGNSVVFESCSLVCLVRKDGRKLVALCHSVQELFKLFPLVDDGILVLTFKEVGHLGVQSFVVRLLGEGFTLLQGQCILVFRKLDGCISIAFSRFLHILEGCSTQFFQRKCYPQVAALLLNHDAVSRSGIVRPFAHIGKRTQCGCRFFRSLRFQNLVALFIFFPVQGIPVHRESLVQGRQVNRSVVHEHGDASVDAHVTLSLDPGEFLRISLIVVMRHEKIAPRASDIVYFITYAQLSAVVCNHTV